MPAQPQHQHRWLLITMAILAASTVSTATAKSTAGKLPKKFIPVVHERPATGPKSLLDRFPAVGRLSADDVSFLKALDRQFVKYGNVKIKVENSTAAASTPKSNGAGKKRTINSELGYGYYGQHQQAEAAYSFSQPQLQVYPYSQHDIPPLPGYQQHQQQQHQQQLQHQQQYSTGPQNHQSQQYSVQIEPSLSFELESTPYGYQSVGQQQQQHHQQHQQQQQPDVPVIVLRIPGPHKYAAHLQQLLQQYLELRAAEYITAVQQQEQQQQQQQHYRQEPAGHHQQQYYEPSAYAQPQFVEQQQQQVPRAHAQTAAYAEDTYQPTATDQDHYQQAQPQPRYGVPATAVDASHLPIQENYPSNLHTRVIYTGHGSHTGARYTGGYHSHGTQVQPDYYDEEDGGQQQRPYIYAYQQQHPQQQQQEPAGRELDDHDQQRLQHVGAEAEVEQEEPTGAHQQQQHNQHYEQMAQLSTGYEQPSAAAAVVDDDDDDGQHEHEPEPAQYAAVDPNRVSITHRPPTEAGAAADHGEYTHSAYDRPYNYHAHGAGNERRHQADDVHERAASRY